MRGSRLKRILHILIEVESGRVTSVDYLVCKLGASRRTIFRDLQALAEAGIKCTFDRTLGRYISDRISDGIVPFNGSECLSLLILFCNLDTRPFVKSQAHLPQAISKVIGAMPPLHRKHSFNLLRLCHPSLVQSVKIRELESLLES